MLVGSSSHDIDDDQVENHVNNTLYTNKRKRKNVIVLPTDTDEGFDKNSTLVHNSV